MVVCKKCYYYKERWSWAKICEHPQWAKENAVDFVTGEKFEYVLSECKNINTTGKCEYFREMTTVQ